MKKLFYLFLFLICAGISNAQWVVQSFDNAATPFFRNPPVLNTNFFTDGPTAYFNVSDTTDSYEGTGSTKINYRVEAFDSWGGYNVRTTYSSDILDSLPYMDFSAGTELSLWYKVITPADTSQAGQVFTELKLAEYNDEGQRDLWYYQTAIDYFDNSGQWKNVRIPLEQNADQTLGLAPQFADGDGVLQLDHIKGFEFSIVYLTAGSSTNTPTATGTILFDRLELIGNRYVPFATFDDTTKLFDAFDWMDWESDPANKGSINLTINTSDKVEGTGSMQFDYTVNCAETWGGYVNMTHHFSAVPDTFAERTALVLFIKNLTPHTGTANRLTMRFFLSEDNTGVNEDWVCEVPIDLSQASDWTRYYLPLKQDTVYTENGHTHFPAHGFAQPWWSITGDNIFNPEALTAWKIELSGGGSPEYGAQGEKFTGTLLFDILQQSGFQFADHEAPAAPQNVNVVQGTYTNLVTWTDVTGESGEKYFIYASEKPITDVNAPGVDILASNIGEGIQVVDHVLIAPLTDQDVTYYYAVQCIDKAGNIGDPSTFGPITNTAQGTAVIAWNKPANFAADGNLSEWDGIKPFRMFPSDGSGHIVTNTVIDGDNDLSCNAWVAMSPDTLFFAFDITDDIISPDVSVNSWENDCPDLFLGLYEWAGATHTGYRRGGTPDFHMRFLKSRMLFDNPGADSLLIPGPDYYWQEKFPSGYIVEGKISFQDLATKRRPASTDTLFVAKEGMRIPIDFEINDADNAIRSGQLDYSNKAGGNSYANVTLWTYTYLGSKITGINDPGLINKYELSQNYPNPFNPSTQINYSIEKPGLVTIRVFDILGRQVAALLNKEQQTGSYTINFNARNLASGVYIYTISSGSFQASKKMLLMK